MIGLWGVTKDGETLVPLKSCKKAGWLEHSEKKLRLIRWSSYGPLTQGLILHYYPFWGDK